MGLDVGEHVGRQGSGPKTVEEWPDRGVGRIANILPGSASVVMREWERVGAHRTCSLPASKVADSSRTETRTDDWPGTAGSNASAAAWILRMQASVLQDASGVWADKDVLDTSHSVLRVAATGVVV